MSYDSARPIAMTASMSAKRERGANDRNFAPSRTAPPPQISSTASYGCTTRASPFADLCKSGTRNARVGYGNMRQERTSAPNVGFLRSSQLAHCVLRVNFEASDTGLAAGEMRDRSDRYRLTVRSIGEERP